MTLGWGGVWPIQVQRMGRGTKESGEALVLGLRRLRSHWGSGRKKHSI